MREVNETTARAIIRQGPLVLVMQGMCENFCHLVGGHLNKGETPEHAVRREVKEETGGTIVSLQKRAIIENDWMRFIDGEGCVLVHETMHLYDADIIMTPVVHGEYWVGMRWMEASPVLYDMLRPVEVIPYILENT